MQVLVRRRVFVVPQVFAREQAFVVHQTFALARSWLLALPRQPVLQAEQPPALFLFSSRADSQAERIEPLQQPLSQLVHVWELAAEAAEAAPGASKI